jgi:hypothetical protein
MRPVSPRHRGLTEAAFQSPKSKKMKMSQSKPLGTGLLDWPPKVAMKLATNRSIWSDAT